MIPGDDDNPIYETGYYEERETELLGPDLTKTIYYFSRPNLPRNLKS